jgi:hypothetical protein
MHSQLFALQVGIFSIVACSPKAHFLFINNGSNAVV